MEGNNYEKFLHDEAKRLESVLQSTKAAQKRLVKDVSSIGAQVYIVTQRYEDGSGEPPCAFTSRENAIRYIEDCAKKHKDWQFFDDNENYKTYITGKSVEVTYNIWPVTLNVGEDNFQYL